MHDLEEPHLAALKRILRYLQGTLSYGLTLHRSPPVDLLSSLMPIGLVALILIDRHLAMQYSLVTTWFPGLPSANRLSRSSAEAEYRVIGMVLPKFCGYISFLMSFATLFIVLH
jgi:hypothetical protein